MLIWLYIIKQKKKEGNMIKYDYISIEGFLVKQEVRRSDHVFQKNIQSPCAASVLR